MPIKFHKKKVGLVRGIAQAKNGGKLFCEEKFHAANGKAQAGTQGALHFSFSVGGGFGGGFLLVFPGSHYGPFTFPSGSQYVPQVLNVFPNMFSIAPHINPYALANVVLLSHIYGKISN